MAWNGCAAMSESRGTLRICSPRVREGLQVPQSSTATFGDLLRHHRLAAGLTQEALAEQAGLSVHGIQKLERGATHPYRDTAERLMLALRLAPDDQARFRAAVQPVRRHGTSWPLHLISELWTLSLMSRFRV
jgi:transcriptional regulator with XRE-family HTH domain